jgi:hypothetical protein
MTYGEKMAAWVATGIATILLSMAATSMVMGHIGWQNLNNACVARGGNVIRVDSNDICATVEYKVTPR